MPQERTRIVAIYGPTAVGKSRVAVETAKSIDGEIVSADSMQVYSGIPIITDQPPRELMEAVPHHLVGFVPLAEEYSAARFTEDAAVAISAIGARGHVPVLVGGTGLYIRALLGGFSFAGTDEEARTRWEEYLESHGPGAALVKLRELDAEAAAAVDAENPRRLVRALEAAESGGSILEERDRLWSSASPFDVISFALELPRERLYEAIDERVDAMLAGGAVDEVEAALSGGLSRTVAQAIGVPEIAAFLDGDLELEEAAATIKQKSRNYARRQLTWMRKMPDIARIDVAGRTAEDVAGEIVKRIRSAHGTPST